MSDANDALVEAILRTRRHAAGRIVRRDEIDAELARRKGDRAQLAAMDPSPEVQALSGELDARIAALATERAAVDDDLRKAQAEIADLERLRAGQPAAAAKATIAAATASDPVLRSPEEIALENARGHIRDLEARVRVDAELAATTKPDDDPPAADKPAPAAPPKKTI
jgi:hypothetical protein